MVDAGAHGQRPLADAPFRHRIAHPAAEVAIRDAARKKQVIHESYPQLMRTLVPERGQREPWNEMSYGRLPSPHQAKRKEARPRQWLGAGERRPWTLRAS